MSGNSNVINDAGGASINIIRADQETQAQHIQNARVNDHESPELHGRVNKAAQSMPNTIPDSTETKPLSDRKITVRNIKDDLKLQSKELKKLKMSSTLIKAQQVGGAILIGVGGLALVTGLVACFCGQPAGLAGVVVGMGMIVGGGMLMTAAANADKKYTPEQRANYETNVKNLKETIQQMEKYPKSETPNGRSYEEFLANFSNNPEQTNPIGDLNKLASLYKLTRLENDHEMVKKDINEVTAKLTLLEEKLGSTDLPPKERKLAEKEKKELTSKLNELVEEMSQTPNPTEVAKLTAELKSHQTAAKKEANTKLDAADSEAADSNPVDDGEAEGVHADGANLRAANEAKLSEIKQRLTEIKGFAGEQIEPTSSSVNMSIKSLKEGIRIWEGALRNNTYTSVDIEFDSALANTPLTEESIQDYKDFIAANAKEIEILEQISLELKEIETTHEGAIEQLQVELAVLQPYSDSPQAARDRMIENKHTATELRTILAEKGIANADDKSIDDKIEELRKIVKDSNDEETQMAAKIDIITINTARLELRKKESTKETYLYESEANFKAEQQALDALLEDFEHNPPNVEIAQNAPSNAFRSEEKYKAEQQALDALLEDIQLNPPKTGIAQNTPSNAVKNENPIIINNQKIQETEVQIKHNNEELQKKREELRQDREHRAALKSDLESIGITFPLKKEQVESKYKELTDNDAKLRAELKLTEPPKTLEQIKKLEADIVESRMHITKFAELIKEYKKSHEIGVLKDENSVLRRQKTALSMENMEASLNAHLDTPEIKLATMKERRLAIQKRLIELGVGNEIPDQSKKVTSDNIDAAIKELEPKPGDFLHEGHKAIIDELKALKEERKQLHEQRNLLEKQLKK